MLSNLFGVLLHSWKNSGEVRSKQLKFKYHNNIQVAEKVFLSILVDSAFCWLKGVNQIHYFIFLFHTFIAYE
jgi:hypothetical protein